MARNPFHRVAPEFHADEIITMRKIDFHAVTCATELPALWGDVVPRILDINQLPQQLLTRHVFIDRHFRLHRVEIVRRTQSVKTRNRTDNDDIPSFEQRSSRRKTQPLQTVVDQRILCDIRIRLRDIRFRLIVVIVADEILHGVFRKERLQFTVQLRSQRLVVRNDQRRPLAFLNEIRHCERLAGSRHA